MSDMSDSTEMEGRVQAALPHDFSAMLDKVLSNPEILTTVASALSGVSGSEAAPGEAVQKKQKAEDAAEEVSASVDVDAMMQKLPQMMKMLTPMLSSASKNQGGAPHSSDKRACLLLAIKPYLSPARCEAIDYIIKFSKLSEILKTIN